MHPSNDTHSKAIGYILWIFGFFGAHRFYYGKPVTGTIWFFTLGLLFVGWIIDLFLIPGMDDIFLLTRILSEVESDRYDTIIVDCSPTAGALRMLTMSDTAAGKNRQKRAGHGHRRHH